MLWISHWGHRHSLKSSSTGENWTRLPVGPLQNHSFRRADKAVSLLGTPYSQTRPPWSQTHLIPAPISPMAHKIARPCLPSWQNKTCVGCHSCGRVAMENTTGMTGALKATKKVCGMFGKRETGQSHQPSQQGTLPGLLHHWHVLVNFLSNGFVRSLCPSLSEKTMHVSAFNIHPFKKLQQGGNVDSWKGVAYRSILLNKNRGCFYMRVLPVGAFLVVQLLKICHFNIHALCIYLHSLTSQSHLLSQLGLRSSFCVLPVRILTHILGTHSAQHRVLNDSLSYSPPPTPASYWMKSKQRNGSLINPAVAQGNGVKGLGVSSSLADPWHVCYHHINSSRTYAFNAAFP